VQRDDRSAARLRALDLSGEVITTPFTFPATVHAIEWSGLTPVFCDVDPETYNLDPESAADLISDRTSALLPVHVFGNPCDVVALERLASRRHLRLLFDAAHAFGVSTRGRAIGTWGDLTVMSFHATKLFHTAEGGAVVGRDPRLLERIAGLRNFAIRDEAEMPGVGINGRCRSCTRRSASPCSTGSTTRCTPEAARGRATSSGFTASMASCRRGWRRGRKRTTPTSQSASIPMASAHARSGAPGAAGREHRRPALLLAALFREPIYRGLPSAAPERLPNAHRVASRTLCLPLYGDLELDDVDRIAGALLALRDAAPRVRARLGTAAVKLAAESA
jgi:dTDP-4-amino-4,6-dideoxygalactose transaminase